MRRGAELFVVVPQTPAGFVPPRAPAGLRVRLVERRRWRGFHDVAVYRYARGS